MGIIKKFYCWVCKMDVNHKVVWRDGKEYAVCPRCGTKTELG